MFGEEPFAMLLSVRRLPRSAPRVPGVRVIRTLCRGLVLLLIACEKPPEPAAAPVVENERAPSVASGGGANAPSGVASVATWKSRKGSTASASESTPSPEPAKREKRAPSGGNTRGLVQCGDFTCAPGQQACVRGSEWQCLAADAVPNTAEVIYRCDDGTDCPQGE